MVFVFPVDMDPIINEVELHLFTNWREPQIHYRVDTELVSPCKACGKLKGLPSAAAAIFKLAQKSIAKLARIPCEKATEPIRTLNCGGEEIDNDGRWTFAILRHCVGDLCTGVEIEVGHVTVEQDAFGITSKVNIIDELLRD